MTLLEHELGKMSNDALRRMAASSVPTTAAAAQAELDSRPSANRDDGEAWIRRTFPHRPNPAS